MRDKSWSQLDLETDMAANKLKASSSNGTALESSPQIEWVTIGTLRPNPRNGRTHSKKQVKQIAASIRQFGFINPLIVDGDNIVLAGGGRLAAARLNGLTHVPVIRFHHLSMAQKRAYVIADNKIAEQAGWDRELLAVELGELVDLLPAEGMDVSLTGFEAAEIDLLLADMSSGHEPEDVVPPLPQKAVARPGDLRLLAKHRLLCGDAREAANFGHLMNGVAAAAVFCDPPYNVRVSSIGGRGRVRHSEFAFGSGEMRPAQYRQFLCETLGKSIAASVAFPAFVLGHAPSKRIICVSYSGDLAKKHSNDFRAVLESRWYRSAFPGSRIGPFKNSETEIELTARGFRLATSVGGTLTGRGGDMIVIDDPLKPDDAMSEVKRSTANQWFSNTLLSRLDDKRTGAIVVVMQRVHVDDLTGFLLEQSDEWNVLSLPAIADSDEVVPTWGGQKYQRRLGEALSPEREPIEVLEALKLQIGSDAFSAQYQQMPAPPGGAMIKRDWIIRYTQLPPAAERLLILQSWDTASKGGPENDWSVCTTWIVTRKRQWYLVDVWRRRVDYPTLKAAVQTLAAQWKVRRVLVEDAGAGTALVQELRGKVGGIIAVKPEGDKVSRMAIASAKFEARQVLLPERASWLADLEAELFVFPGSRHDDQCDSISQALLDRNTPFWAWLTPTDREVILRKSRIPRARPIVARY